MAENQKFAPIVSPLPDVEISIVSNADGTYSRTFEYPKAPSSPDPHSSSSPVLSKDIPINTTKKTWLRLYIPRHLLCSSSTTNNHHHPLPLIVYYHGGGFIFGTVDMSMNHDFCNFLSEHMQVVIASVAYRCAPEHRLPAAYEDAFEALQFIKLSKDDWLRKFTDISSCFLMGTSAGGNMSYETGIRVCRSGRVLEPLKVKGLVLHHPYFSGSKRTGSELKMRDTNYDNDNAMLDATDKLWEVCLPVGSDRDHEYCNPMTLVDSSSKLIRETGLKVLLLGSYKDPLIDRELELTKTLEKNGVMIAAHFGECYHAEEMMDLSKDDLMFSILKDFISSSATI
ncbi:alpha/beta-Hydrolases superfamily protein [Euphorbia peplus]|nr:alpha/beta-Hydrolases superfamily protein [Euphorbia peplus]